MTFRKPLIAGNWKMNSAPAGFDAKDSPYRTGGVDVVVFPAFTDIAKCVHAQIVTGAQYGRAEASGAFTGDVSMPMIAAAGCRYVLCGHSERRRYHHESDEEVAEQAVAALEANLHPVICVGETADEREMKKHKHVIERQLKLLPKSGITIAYEPVWAIGTGKTATPEDAEDMHAFIRSLLGKEGEGIRILYGGSMNAKNAKDLLSQKNIDGGLIGGASLKIDEFRMIVETASML